MQFLKRFDEKIPFFMCTPWLSMSICEGGRGCQKQQRTKRNKKKQQKLSTKLKERKKKMKNVQNKNNKTKIVLPKI